MKNQDIDKTIAYYERRLRISSLFGPTLSWLGSAGVCGATIFAGASQPINFLTGCLLAISVYLTSSAIIEMRKSRNFKAYRIWELVGESPVFVAPDNASLRHLGKSVRQIYEIDPAGEVLPLSQAIRLLDTYWRQQERSRKIAARLEELQALREELSSKIAQLQELGESRTGLRELNQIETDIEALKKVPPQIDASCRRLEVILISVKRAAQARKLHRELDDLRARVPRPAEAADSAFEAQSITEIERQIGREIETYLQLERETDEHLR